MTVATQPCFGFLGLESCVPLPSGLSVAANAASMTSNASFVNIVCSAGAAKGSVALSAGSGPWATITSASCNCKEHEVKSPLIEVVGDRAMHFGQARL